MTDRKTLWSSGANAGLALGGVSIAYALLTLLTSKLGGAEAGKALLASVINFFLWAGKFAGCIILMKALMKKFAAIDGAIDNRDTLNFGIIAALLSAVLYSAFQMAYIQFINPDSVKEAFDTVMETMSSKLDYNSITAIEKMSENMAPISFFSNLIYCFLFGTVLSAILSRNIPSRNPFEKRGGATPDEQ